MLPQQSCLCWNHFQGMNWKRPWSHIHALNHSRTSTAPFMSLEQLLMEMRSLKCKQCPPSQPCSPWVWHTWRQVWERWKRLLSSTSAAIWSQNPIPLTPLVLIKEKQITPSAAIRSKLMEWMQGESRQEEKKHHLSHPLYMLKWKNMPLPFVPPIFLYDQASSSLTSQEWCPRAGCGKENICYFIKTARFKPCCQTCRFYE